MDTNALTKIVKDKISLSSVVGASVKLRGRSPNFLGLCPFHQEKTPSFHVRDSVGRFKCFGCGIGGDVFEFLMKQRGISFKEALSELALKAGIALKSHQKEIKPTTNIDVLKAQSVAHTYFVEQLLGPSGKDARDYLRLGRGLQEKMIKQAGLGFGGISSENFFKHLVKHGISERGAMEAGLIKEGYDKKIPQFLSRITFPIRDFDGRIIAFAGRSFLVEDKNAPKYLNTHSYSHYEKRKNFYGIYESKASILKGMPPILVEGYFDAMAMWALGVPALALCGTAFSQEHAKFLSRLTSRVLICFDNDNAGLLALNHSLMILLEHGFTTNLIVLHKKDPGDYLATGTLDELSAMVKKPTDALCFLIEQGSEAKQGSIDERLRYIDSLLPIFATLKRPLLRRQYVAYLAKHLHEDPALLWAEISRQTKKKIKKEVLISSSQQLNSRERLLLAIAFSAPSLVIEMTEVESSISDGTKGILEAIASLYKETEKMSPQFKSKVLEINKALWPVVEEIFLNSVRFSHEEAKDLLSGLKNKIVQKKLKDSIKQKWLEVQRFEKTGDFSSMLKSLSEKRDLLQRGRASRLAAKKEESSWAPQKKNPSTPHKKTKEIKTLSEEANFFDSTEDWY